MDSSRLQVHFDIHQPIELVDFTMAMKSLAYEYESFLIERSGVKRNQNKDREDKLFITKIENNCILAELAGASALMGHMITTKDQIKVFFDFVKNLDTTINYFINLASKKNEEVKNIPYSKNKIDNIKYITELAAKNENSKLGLSVINYKDDEENKTIELAIIYDTENTKKTQQGIAIAREALNIKEGADHKKVLMYFHQVNRSDPKKSGSTGHKAIISRITEKPLKCYILTNSGSQKLRHIFDDKYQNPLQIGFIVDVNVEKTLDGEPVHYNILKLHETINEN